MNWWTCKKAFTILGSLLLMLPIGLPWYWGNMVIYARSYIARHGDTVEGLQTPWIISFYFLFNAVGMFIAGFLSKYAGKRLTLGLGVLLFLGGGFLTNITLNISLMMVNLTLGFVAGVGGGIVNGMALQYAVSWADVDLGFVTSFVQGGFNAGPVFINPFITYLVNPDNLTPDVDLGANKLFSQKDVIDRVPSMFYSFGILCSALQLVGFVIVRESPETSAGEAEPLHPKTSSPTSLSSQTTRPGDYHQTNLSKQLPNGNHHQSTLPSQPNGHVYNTTQQETQLNSVHHTELPTQPNGNALHSDTSSDSNGSSNYSGVFKDLKPIEIIKTKSFFTLSFCLMMFDNSMLVLANYYKGYGAEWIDNDHFLTMIATALTLSTIVAFPFWGALTDRIGVKRVLIQMFSVSSVLTISMYFTPRLNRWAYLVNVALSGWFLPPIFSILIIATCKLFGKTYYSSNIGLVSSLSFLVNFVNPMIFEAILTCGWFYTFIYGASLTTAALIFIAIFLPRI